MLYCSVRPVIRKIQNDNAFFREPLSFSLPVLCRLQNLLSIFFATHLKERMVLVPIPLVLNTKHPGTWKK